MKSNLAIGQSGGPTAVINATLVGIIRAAKRLPEFSGVYGLAHGLEGTLTSNFIDLSGLSDDTLGVLAHTPAAALGSSRRKLDESEYLCVIENFQSHDISHFAYIGGNGSMDAVGELQSSPPNPLSIAWQRGRKAGAAALKNRFANSTSMWVAQHIAEIAAAQNYDLCIVGAPKTIDNDLPCTDHTPGYGSAARFLALATRDAGLDLESMQTFDDVIILESMGRDTGWLAAASALLKESDDDAPHLIYVPEIPFDEQQFLDDITHMDKKFGRVFVVVAEGIRDASGQIIGQQSEKDALGRTIHGFSAGPAAYLTTLVRERLGLQIRFFRPGLIGRASSACVSEVDFQEVFQVGEAAANLLVAGQSGVMVSIPSLNPSPLRRQGLREGAHFCTIPLVDVASADIKRLPREYMNADGTMISDAFRHHALPLIGEAMPVMRLRKGTKEIP